LKFVIRIDDIKTPGFMNFKELYDIASEKDLQFIRDINVSEIDPNDPTNI